LKPAMKIFLFVFLLCTAQIVAAYQDYEEWSKHRTPEAMNIAGRTMAIIWDISYTCSLSCVQPPMLENAVWSLYLRCPKEETHPIIPACLTGTCDHIAKLKPCLSQCPDGSMKTIMTILSTPFDAACSETFRTMIKNNMHCVSDSSISNIYKPCVQTCPAPDCRGNDSYPRHLITIPTLMKTCGTKACEFFDCMTQCFANRLGTETKCDPKAIDMIKDLVAETARASMAALLQGGMTENEIPSACKKLAD